MNTIIHTNNFQAFETARQYACYLGIAPFEHSSGTSIKGKTRVYPTGAKLLKADLSQAANSAIVWDKERVFSSIPLPYWISHKVS